MKKKLCFIIDNAFLYTDICLIRDEIPIFFVCKDNSDKYYIVLCVDMDELQYNIVEVTDVQLYNMLLGNISMREIFTEQDEYWKVTPTDNKVENDIVQKKKMKEIDADELPDEGARFKLFSKELEDYTRKIGDGIGNLHYIEGSLNCISPIHIRKIFVDTNLICSFEDIKEVPPKVTYHYVYPKEKYFTVDFSFGRKISVDNVKSNILLGAS